MKALSFLPEKISTFIHEINQALVLPETGSSDVVPVASSLNVIPKTGLSGEHKKKKKTRRKKKKSEPKPKPVQETHAKILTQLQEGSSYSVDNIQTPQSVTDNNETFLSELVHEASPFSFKIGQEKSWADMAEEEEEEKEELIKKKTY